MKDDSPKKEEIQSEILRSLSGSQFNLLTETGESIITETSDSLVLFSVGDLIPTSGLAIVSGSYNSIFIKYNYLPTGIIRSSGFGECSFRNALDYEVNVSVSMILGGEVRHISVKMVRPDRINTNNGIVVSGPRNIITSFRSIYQYESPLEISLFVFSTISTKFNYDSKVQISAVINSTNTILIKQSSILQLSLSNIFIGIRSQKYTAIGTIVASVSTRSRKVIFKHTVDPSGLSLEGEANTKFLIKHRSPVRLSLSNIFIGIRSQKYTAIGTIVASVSTRSRKVIFKHTIDPSVSSLEGEANTKFLIRRLSVSRLSLSNVFIGIRSQNYTARGTIVTSVSTRSRKVIFKHTVDSSGLSLEGEANVKFLIRHLSLIESFLSNVISYKLTYIYLPPQPPIFLNSAFNYRGLLGGRYLFNITATKLGSDIWGTDTYTVDSDLRLIAAHMGILNDNENGNIVVEITNGQTLYLGSERNGVVSRRWNSNTYLRSLQVSSPSLSVTGTGIESYIFYSNIEVQVLGSSSSKTSILLFVSGNISGSAQEYVKYLFNCSNNDIFIEGQGHSGSVRSSVEFSVLGLSKSIVIRKADSRVNLEVTSTREEFARNNVQYQSESPLIELNSNNIYYPFEAIYNFDIGSSWIVGGTGLPDFSLNLASSWSSYSEEYYWYRVLFCGNANEIQSTCDPIFLQNSETTNYTRKFYRTSSPLPDNEFISSLSTREPRPSSSCKSILDHAVDPSCGDALSLITGVLARNLSEVCEILKNPRFGPPQNSSCFKCISIKKYIQPVSSTDGNPIYSELIDQEFCNTTECLEFCIDFDLARELGKEPCNNGIEFTMTVMTNIFSHLSNGSFSLLGRSDALLFWFEPTGQSVSIIGSETEVTCNRHEYVFSINFNLRNSGLSNTSPDPYPIMSELGSNLLLEQAAETLDLESSIYETQDGILDLTEYYSVIINKRIAPNNVEFEISGNSYIVLPYWKHIEENNFINIELSHELFARISYTANPRYAYFDIGGTSSIQFRRYFSYVGSYGNPIEIRFKPQIESNFFYYESGPEISIVPPSVDLISPYRAYTGQGQIYIDSQDRPIGKSAIGNIEIEISGSSESKYVYVNRNINYLSLSGNAQTYSPNYSYDAILEANAQILTAFYFRSMGTFVSKAEASAEISSVSFDSVILDSFSNLSINNAEINTCGCLSLDLNLNVLHNLNSAGVLSQFLTRNNYSLSDSLVLRYNSNKDSWISSVNFRGLGLDPNTNEDWNLILELGCNNIINGQINDNYYLKFNLFARRINRTSNINWITNISTNIVPESVCQNGNLITKINLNTVTQSIFVDDALSPFSNIVDNIGLFKNSYWKDRVNCSVAREDYLGEGRRDGFASCGITGPFPEFRINYPRNPVMNVFELAAPQQVIL